MIFESWEVEVTPESHTRLGWDKLTPHCLEDLILEIWAKDKVLT